MADLENREKPTEEGAAPPRQTPIMPSARSDNGNAGNGKPSPIVRRPKLRRPGEPATAKPEATAPGPLEAAEKPQPAVAKPVPAETPEPAAKAQPAAPKADAAPAAGVPIPSSEASKRKTSRVELPASLPADNEDDAGEFKTVRVRPTPPPKPGSAPLPNGPKPLTSSQKHAAKSKTSRISLEAALGSDDADDTSAPKTIRLKRPSELKSGSAGPAATPVAAPSAVTAMPGAKTLQQSSTAKLPTQALPTVTPTEAESTSPTRRKTIKIKRPQAAGGVKIKVGGKGDSGQTEEAGDGEMQPVALPPGMQSAKSAASESVNPVFIVAAVVALLLTLGVVWILASQTFGPNAALTGYTSRKGPDIAPPPGLASVR